MIRRFAVKALGRVHRPLIWLVLHEAWRYGLEGDEAAPFCAVCGGEAPGYMVTDDVWSAAGLGYEDGWVCPDCLAGRLGRLLAPRDLVPLPINLPSRMVEDDDLAALKVEAVRSWTLADWRHCWGLNVDS